MINNKNIEIIISIIKITRKNRQPAIVDPISHDAVNARLEGNINQGCTRRKTNQRLAKIYPPPDIQHK